MKLFYISILCYEARAQSKGIKKQSETPKSMKKWFKWYFKTRLQIVAPVIYMDLDIF